MKDLNEYGIMMPRSVNEPRYQERTTISHEEFCSQAGEFLLRLTQPVIDNVVPKLEDYPASWQPMGFQIYDLGIYPELGFLRLHVWPEKVRRAAQRTEIIHNHPRHIGSTVISGTYRDTIFDTRQASSNDANSATDLYTVYGKTINSDQTEVLFNEGGTVEAVVKEERIIPEGGQHFIAPGVFHQTKVPLTDSCVTLIFNSFRTGADGPYMLMDEPPVTRPELREPITTEEIEAVKELFTCN